MRALRFDRYGAPDVLRIEDIPAPKAAPGEAIVRVRAVALNPLDWKIRAGHVRLIPIFRGPPRGLGVDFAGEIEAVGGGPTERHVGERVFGSLLPFGRDGALAEYIAVAYERLIPLPGDVDELQAAALPVAGGTALHALIDEAHVGDGERVLITGAAGGVGHFAVQIAKHLGAYTVGVCSAANVDFVGALGADEVVDYAKADFTLRSDRFDVVLDAAGTSRLAKARRVLTERGCYVSTGGTAGAVANTAIDAMVARLTSRQRAVVIAVKNRPSMWRRLLELAREGTLRAHIERVIRLDEVVQAYRDMETGHGRGKIVVRLVEP